MLKKFATALALIGSTSFATWDYFPVLEAGRGTAEGGLYYDWDGDWSQAGLNIGARYSVIDNLELSLQGWGYQFWSETDCKGCKEEGDGLRDLTIGARYQFLPIVNAFVDLHLPIGNDDPGRHPSSDEIALYIGAQYSMAIPQVPGLVFGTEGGFLWGFEHDNVERGLEIHMGGEVDYTIANIGLTPYIGTQFKLRLTESTWEGTDENGKKAEYGADDNGDNQIIIWFGASYAIDPNISVKLQFIVRSGDQNEPIPLDGDARGLYLGCDYNF